METLENSKVLKLLGLDDKNKWILHDEKAQKFFEYIANNFDESNILTDSEIQEYEDLKSAGLVLSDEDLEKELKNIESTFPGFFSVTDEKIKALEEEVKKLEAETTERAERLSRMQECEDEQLRNIAKIERENHDILFQQQLLTDECKAKAKELSNLQKSNTEKIAQLNQIYLQPVSVKTSLNYDFLITLLF
jgi:hypothetical protein